MQITHTLPASIPTSIPTSILTAATRHMARAALLTLTVTAPALSQTSVPPVAEIWSASDAALENGPRFERADVAAAEVLTQITPPAGVDVATSFDQLRVLVGSGAKVTVINSTGDQTTGTISALTPSSLSLGVNGKLRDFGEQDVATIRQRRSDSLRDGTLWGLGIGAGVGFVLGGAIGAEELGEAAFFFGGFLAGGIGAAIGVGVDAMIRGNQVIYSKAAGSAPIVTLRPALTRGRVGVLASLAF